MLINKNMDNIIETKIHLSELEQGMTVKYKGELVTVSKKHIKYDPFFGYTFMGDSSNQYITKVQFVVPTLKGIQLR